MTSSHEVAVLASIVAALLVELTSIYAVWFRIGPVQPWFLASSLALLVGINGVKLLKIGNIDSATLHA